MIERNKELSISSRSNPALTSTGVPIGRFNLFPSITTDFQYTDNLYASENNDLEDNIFKINPVFSLQSDFERHALNFNVTGQKTFHDKNSAEDYFEYNLGTNARYDIGSEFSIPLSLSYGTDTIARGSPDDEGALERTEYDVSSARTGIVYNGSDFTFDVTMQMRDLTYDDTRTGTGIENNSDRDRQDTRISSRAGLSTRAGIMPYMFVGYRDIEYDQTLDDNGFNRSSEEIEAGIGARFDLSALVESNIQIGYINYKTEDIRFDAFDDFSFSADINWEPTPLLGLSFGGSRTVEETTLGNISSSVDSSLSLAANYELTPSFFFRPRISYLDKDYDDNIRLERFTYNFDVNYKMNRNAWWTAGYQHISQNDPHNSAFISEYEKNNFLLSLRLQL